MQGKAVVTDSLSTNYHFENCKKMMENKFFDNLETKSYDAANLLYHADCQWLELKDGLAAIIQNKKD